MIRKIMLSLLILFAATSAANAAPQTFNERKANMAELHAMRIGYGVGTVRIVFDLTKEVTFKESYLEYPSRMIVDLQNTWLNPTVQREIELKSTAAQKIRIAQFDSSTVRIVVESMSATKLFFLEGGKCGHRFVIDVGNTDFKADPELNKTEAERERERRERELQAQRERELQAQRERELQAQRERELQAQRERELQAQRERELQAQRERELQAQRERELQAQRERELQAQREKEKELERRERELEKREKEQREKELKEQRERELKEQREREKELKEQEKRERKERERLEKEQREREKRERKERERLEKEQREKDKREGKDKDQDNKEQDNKDQDKDKEREVDKPINELDNDLNTLTNLKGKIIAIDPGHGGNDAGAIGPTGVMEKSVTLKVSLELRRLLEAEGATVIMTRDTDKTVSSKGAKASDIEELGARCEIANIAGADIFISIHADSFTRPEARGTTGYYYSRGSGAGQKLADCIRRNLVEQLGTPSRGTQPCNFYVVKHTDMPATLIELGFISNKEEEKLLDSADGVKRAAQGIMDGIEDYFG